jgi:trimeric autotransporter adhesin
MPLSLDGTTGISASGNITGGNVIASGSLVVGSFAPASVSTAGNVTGGNILTAGIMSSAGNVTGGNISTGGLINATGNVTGGNIRTAGLISVTGSITGASVVGGIMTGTSLSVTGNVDGGNIRTAGLISATGAITAGGDLSLIGNIVDTGPMTVTTSSNGNITLAPNGTGVVVVNTDIRNGQANGVGNIGASGAAFNTVFARSTSALYADLAENYVADANYTPGTVLEFGGDNEVTQTTSNHRTQVAGIASTNPSYLMNAGISGDKVVAVALTGRVPCYVIGNIVKGDRLVSSDTLGVATVLDMTQYQPGCIIGKALENYNSQEIGIIEVAVGRF